MLLSILEATYLVFMFHFFQTDIDFNILPQIDILKKNELLGHLHGKRYGKRICLFGQYAIIPFIFIILARHFVSISNTLLLIAIGISFILSFLNYNAIIYLLPVWVIELYFIYFA